MGQSFFCCPSTNHIVPIIKFIHSTYYREINKKQYNQSKGKKTKQYLIKKKQEHIKWKTNSQKTNKFSYLCNIKLRKITHITH